MVDSLRALSFQRSLTVWLFLELWLKLVDNKWPKMKMNYALHASFKSETNSKSLVTTREDIRIKQKFVFVYLVKMKEFLLQVTPG